MSTHNMSTGQRRRPFGLFMAFNSGVILIEGYPLPWLDFGLMLRDCAEVLLLQTGWYQMSALTISRIIKSFLSPRSHISHTKSTAHYESSTTPSGLLKTTLDSPISQSVLHLSNGNISSNHSGPMTFFTGPSSCSSSSTQFLSHISCGLGSTMATYRSRSPAMLAIIFHPCSQLAVSSRYASRCEGPRRRYGRARIAQRRRSVRIVSMRG